MTDDSDNRMHETPLPQAAEPSGGPSANILDSLDIADVGEIDIPFERPLRHPRPVTFD